MREELAWKRELLKRIDEFAKYEKNWDSYGADPPTVEAMEKAKEVASALMVVPAKDGGMSVGYEGECSGWWMEIAPDGSIRA